MCACVRACVRVCAVRAVRAVRAHAHRPGSAARCSWNVATPVHLRRSWTVLDPVGAGTAVTRPHRDHKATEPATFTSQKARRPQGRRDSSPCSPSRDRGARGTQSCSAAGEGDTLRHAVRKWAKVSA